MDHNAMIAVLTAHRDGKEIEYKLANSNSEWRSLYLDPNWNFCTFDFRVKPEPPPPPREITVYTSHLGCMQITQQPESAWPVSGFALFREVTQTPEKNQE